MVYYVNDDEYVTCIFKLPEDVVLSDFKRVFKPIGVFHFYFKTIENGCCVKKLVSEDDARVPFYESIMTRVNRDSSYKTVKEAVRGIFCTAKKTGSGKVESYIN